MSELGQNIWNNKYFLTTNWIFNGCLVLVVDYKLYLCKNVAFVLKYLKQKQVNSLLNTCEAGNGTYLRLTAGRIGAAEVGVPLLLRRADAGKELDVLISHLQGAAEPRGNIQIAVRRSIPYLQNF